jgi:hypothetical protein
MIIFLISFNINKNTPKVIIAQQMLKTVIYSKHPNLKDDFVYVYDS